MAHFDEFTQKETFDKMCTSFLEKVKKRKEGEWEDWVEGEEGDWEYWEEGEEEKEDIEPVTLDPGQR